MAAEERELDLIAAHCALGVTTGTGSSHVPGKGWAARRFVLQ
ncbi:hypothetical protein SHJG_1546 [Streptomyces hygroscopicus subsp. jinggangensis 5008]|nr:hypothetical protein SHJG_1546 [Streptomyces hygroscopicus subsp. jinggangensis 5008]AGF61043.1 hypothetical protein SHJGH_1377 [Streptomyces hygroscopicus subsp. jinggangensis TL01]